MRARQHTHGDDSSRSTSSSCGQATTEAGPRPAGTCSHCDSHGCIHALGVHELPACALQVCGACCTIRPLRALAVSGQLVRPCTSQSRAKCLTTPCFPAAPSCCRDRSQSHQPGQLQETACSRGTDHPHTAGPHAGSLQPSSSSSSRSRRQSADHTHTNRGRVAGRHTHASKHGFSYAADSLPSRHTGTWTDHLLARLAAEKKQAQDPEYQAKLRAAVSTPIHVVLMAGTFWSVTEASTRGCQVNGLPLDCRISNDTQSVSQRVQRGVGCVGK